MSTREIVRVRAYSTADRPAYLVITYRDEDGLYQTVSYTLLNGDILDFSSFDSCPPLPLRLM
jgi:hypothetical protein